MLHSTVSHPAARRVLSWGSAWLALLGVLVACPLSAFAQDPLQELKKILVTRPAVDPLLPADKLQAEIKKFYEEREQKLSKIIDSRVRSFGQLRQALLLKEWGDMVKTQREDPELLATDIKLRSKVAQKYRAKIRAVIDKGDDDSKAAAANLITELGLTVRTAIDPDKPAKFEEVERERRAGFARSLTDELERLAAEPNEFVRLHALRALGGVNADPKRAATVFAATLSSGADLQARRIAADGFLRLVGVANYLREKTLTSPAVWATDLDVLLAGAEVVRHAPAGLSDSDGIVRARCAESLRVSAQILTELFKKTDDGKNLPPAPRSYTQAEIDAIKELLKAFEAAGPRLASALQDPEVEVRLQAVSALERLSDARYRLRQDRLEIGAFQKVQARVALIPPEASDPLSSFAKGDWRTVAKLLADPDARVRRGAVHFLEFFEPARPGALPALAKALSDPDRFVRLGATRALGNFSEKRPQDAAPVVSALARLLFDSDQTIRLTAADTLWKLGVHAEAAVPELARAVHFGDVENRVAVLYVLQNIGPERSTAAIGSVTDALEHSDPRVRRIAAETLGNYGALARNKTTIDALRRGLGDDDQDVRINASEALLQVLAAGKD